MSKEISPSWYRDFEFLKGVSALRQLPEDSGREVVFAGRSNVGKSSVINALVGRKALVRTSKAPGCTQQLNYFTNHDGQRLVDLPGYGFARVNQATKRQWSKLIEGYFSVRDSLQGIMLVVDIRRSWGNFDQQMLAYSRSRQIPIHILLNKADKHSKGEARQIWRSLTQQLAHESCSVQLFSASKRQGLEEGRERLLAWLFR